MTLMIGNDWKVSNETILECENKRSLNGRLKNIIV